MAELAKEEAATVRAQVEGIKAGANPAIYTTLFTDIAARRREMEHRLEAMETQQEGNGKQQTWTPENTTHQYATILQDVDEALFAPELNPWERREVLSPLVRSIVPDQEGWRIALRSLHHETSSV